MAASFREKLGVVAKHVLLAPVYIIGAMMLGAFVSLVASPLLFPFYLASTLIGIAAATATSSFTVFAACAAAPVAGMSLFFAGQAIASIPGLVRRDLRKLETRQTDAVTSFTSAPLPAVTQEEPQNKISLRDAFEKKDTVEITSQNPADKAADQTPPPPAP